MGKFSEIWELFTGILKTLSWFIVNLVIPITAWFILLRSDVISLKKAEAETEIRVGIIEENLVKKDELLNLKIEEIIRSLGRIEGEMKRIK